MTLWTSEKISLGFWFLFAFGRIADEGFNRVASAARYDKVPRAGFAVRERHEKPSEGFLFSYTGRGGRGIYTSSVP